MVCREVLELVHEEEELVGVGQFELLFDQFDRLPWVLVAQELRHLGFGLEDEEVVVVALGFEGVVIAVSIDVVTITPPTLPLPRKKPRGIDPHRAIIIPAHPIIILTLLHQKGLNNLFQEPLLVVRGEF